MEMLLDQQLNAWHQSLVEENALIEEKLWPSSESYSETNSTFEAPRLSTKVED